MFDRNGRRRRFGRLRKAVLAGILGVAVIAAAFFVLIWQALDIAKDGRRLDGTERIVALAEFAIILVIASVVIGALLGGILWLISNYEERREFLRDSWKYGKHRRPIRDD
jgi:uncharacterized membrane protein YqgA involved in biofilm formation